MSDIGDLVVRLTMENGGLEKGIRSSEKLLKNQQSDFRALAAEAGGLGKSYGTLTAQATSLGKQINTQGSIVSQYQEKLQKANQKHTEAVKKLADLNTKYSASKQEVTGLKAAVEAQGAAYQAAIKAEGENAESTIALGVAYEDLKGKLAEAEAAGKKLEGQIKSQQNAVVSAGDKVQTAEGQVNRAREAHAKLKNELTAVNKQLKDNSARWTEYGDKLQRAGEKTTKHGKILTTAITAPLAAAATLALKSSIDYESAFASVRKTVDATEAEYQQLSGAVREMSRTLPAGADAIAEIMGLAGQLGVENDALEGFTRTMVDLGEATNLTGESGAEALAKFANVTQMSQKDFDRLGSTLVALGNNSAATEADIMDMAMRLGSAGSQIGLSQDQILGFAAALSSVGIEAQAGGSAFSKIMVQMQLATETGKNGLEDFARVSGMTSAQFQQHFEKDAAGALQAFIVGLSKMDEQGISAIKTLDDMGITEVRLRDTLLRATNANELFSSSLDLAGAEWKENTALAKEAAQRYGTTASKLNILKNKAVDAARTFGDDMNPVLNQGIDIVSGLVDQYMNLDASTRQNIIGWGAFIAGIGPGMMVIGKANSGIGKLVSAVGKLKTGAVDAGGGIKGMFSAVSSGLGPAGWAALIVTAGVLAVKLYDAASGAKALREATEKLNQTAQDWQNTQAKTVFDSGKDPFERFQVDRDTFGSIEEGTKELNRLDKEYDKLIGRMESGKELTEKQRDRLAEVSTQRITLRMELGEVQGFEEIEAGLAAEIARLETLGLDPSSEVYADALKAAGLGKQSGMETLDQEYARQYTEISKLTDETQRKNEIDALNNKYLSERQELMQQYGETVKKISPALFETEEIQKGAEGLMEINKLVGQLTDPSLKKDEKAGIVNQINEALSKTGEDNLTSYIATLSQLEELAVADIDISGIIPEDMPGLKNFEDLKGYLDYIKEEAPELYSVLAEALPDEVDRVTEEMGVSIGSVTIADGVMLPEIPGLEGIIEKARKGDSVTWEGDRPAIEAIATHIIDNIPEEERTLEEKALVNAVLNADSITDGSMQQAIDTYLATIEPTPIRVPIEMEGFNQFILDDAVREASYNVDRFNIGFSASEGIGQIADDINRFNQAAKDMKGTDLEGLADWSEPIASITMIPRENVDNMLTFLSQYRAMLAEGKVPDEETQAYADSITGLFSALSQMELPEDKQDILDNFLAPFLDAFGAADGDSLATYIEGMNALGGDLIAGVAEGMTSAELATVAETVMANLETALREAAESKSPAKRFNPLGDDISAGVGEGAEDYDFSTDAEKVIGNMESALKAAITGTGDGDGFASLGAMIAAALGAGMSGYDFSGSAGTTIGNIKGSIRGAAQIASPAKLFIPDGGFIGAGVGVGMSRYDFRPSARETVQHIAQALMGEEMQPVLVPDYVGRAETIREENMARSYGGGGRNVPAGGDTTHNSNYDMGGINIHNPQFRNEADMYRMMELMDEETRRKIAGVGN